MSQITNTSENPRPEWLFRQNPRAIENQEAQGQKELVASSQLPFEINGPREIAFEEIYPKLGIQVIGRCERYPIFVDVVLPDGWSKKSTEHSMWSRLVDDKGRERADIFYKAAFYDRSAHININRRYTIRSNYEQNVSAPRCFQSVFDNQEQVHLLQFDYREWGEYSKSDEDSKACRVYLEENYPNYLDPIAYWD